MGRMKFEALKQEFPKASNSFLESLLEFDHTFSPYFPHIIGEPNISAFELEWIWTRFSGNPLETVRHSVARNEIRKFVKMVTAISAMDIGYLKARRWVLMEEKSKSSESWMKLFQFIIDVVDLRENGELDATTAAFVENVEIALRYIPDTSNIHWEAVHAVDGLRTLWWRNTGKNAPYFLNPASKFAYYLADGLEFLEVTADPVSAFRRWAAKFGEQTKHEEKKSTTVPGQKNRHPYDYLLKN